MAKDCIWDMAASPLGNREQRCAPQTTEEGLESTQLIHSEPTLSISVPYITS